MTNNTQQKVLVTGGLGFIGTEIALNLSKKDNVLCFVVDNLASATHENMSLIKKSSVETFFDDAGSDKILSMIRNGFFDTIYHTAATPSVPVSMLEPIKTNENNFNLTYKLLDSLSKAPKPYKTSFVFSSTSAVYGDTGIIYPTTEEHLKNPTSHYGLQKFMCEELLKFYNEKYQIKTTALRYSNVFGYRQNPNGSYPNLIAAWRQAVINKEPLKIFGDGTQERDYVTVRSVAEANILSAKERPLNTFEVFNIGSGTSISVNEIAKKLLEVDNKINFIEMAYRPGDVKKTLLDITKANKELGFVIENHFLEKTENGYQTSKNKLLNEIARVILNV